jgi:NADPH:quinone reductase-like Zn-dependent oxidoreductase
VVYPLSNGAYAEKRVLKAGEVVLIHAMTGGVGTLLSDWAKSVGAVVIGTGGSAAKKDFALARGFEYVVNLQSEDFADKVTAVIQGWGIDVVYDSIGEKPVFGVLPCDIRCGLFIFRIPAQTQLLLSYSEYIDLKRYSFTYGGKIHVSERQQKIGKQRCARRQPCEDRRPH